MQLRLTLVFFVAFGLWADDVAKPPTPLTAEQRVPILELSVQIAQLESQYVQAQTALQKLADQHAGLVQKRNELLEQIGREQGVKGWMLDSKLQWVSVPPPKEKP